MIERIRSIVADVAQEKFADGRLHHCQIEVQELEGDRCHLTGTALDQETVATVIQALSADRPSLTVDASGVKVLRVPDPALVTVSTNVTGLHAEPSFKSEMASQVLNGVQVEQLLEQPSWLYVRQDDGYLGWLYRQYVESQPPLAPTHITCRPISHLYATPEAQDDPISRVLAGTLTTTQDRRNGRVLVCLAGGLSGWLPAEDLRPLDALPQDPAEQRRQMIKDGPAYMGVPYLWGGGTAFGIDCSGLVQLLYRLVGITIERDADWQFEAGRPVEPPFQPGDLLFFGNPRGHRSISHVGMSLGGWRTLHSSRRRNGVYVDDVDNEGWLRDIFVGARAFVAG